MPQANRILYIVMGVVVSLAVLAMLLFSSAQASEMQLIGLGEFSTEEFADQIESDSYMPARDQAADVIADDSSVAAATTTTLGLANISSIWAPLDRGNNLVGPNVFVVEAVISNTGPTSAGIISVTLDYNEDAANDWVLLAGEDPVRTIDGLDPGEKHYVYWFAQYPQADNQTHIYTITASASNAVPVSTSDNYWDSGAAETVRTGEYRATGNNGQVNADTNVLVGVAFTVEVNYVLGNNLRQLTFSPAGNDDFDPGATRLLNSSISFQNSGGTTETLVVDQLYFSPVPQLPNGNEPDVAVVTYEFLALKVADTRLCAYTAIRYQTTAKYDNEYCNQQNEIHISGSSSFSLSKSVSNNTVQQADVLTYTIEYSNTGDVALQYVWIWDEIDPAMGTIVGNTTIPSPDPGASNESTVAWYFDQIPAAGQPGSSSTLTVTVLVDGDGQDLTDGLPVVNQAFFGINQVVLPSVPTLTSTATSTIQAPAITINKSDGQTHAGPGESLTYTITVVNNGSAPAAGLVITDTLPADVSLAGTPSPPQDNASGNTLEWYAATLGTLPPNGGALTITIPVNVHQDVDGDDVLTNSATIYYENEAGHSYQAMETVDTTTVVKEAGYVDGHAFIDLDGDGIFDGGESGIPGVTVNLPVAVDPVTTTNGGGYYRFQVEVAGSISATAGLPAGYFRTTPGVVNLDNTFGFTQTLNFGYAPVTADFGVLYGTVYDDANHDGFRAIGENGLSGVTISSTQAASTPVITNDYGQYTLRYDNGGTASVEETNPPYYVSTTPDIVATDVLTGSSNASPLDFGDFQGLIVHGMVFEDSNVNGLNDGENGLTGATVSATGDSYTTTASGVYSLYLSTNGSSIQISESDPAGYVSTNAIPGSGMVKLGDNALQITNPLSGTVYTGDFGDVAADGAITVTGMVWLDDGAGGGGMANGLQDSGEQGLGGALVSLSSGTSQLTGADGAFALRAPANQTITVTESNPIGYVSTNAIPGTNASQVNHDTLLVAALGGGSSSSGNLFGDVNSSDIVSIGGFVWDDNGDGGGTAGDGVWDASEPPLAGAQVSLSSGMSKTTGSDGAFTLYAPPNQVIIVTEKNPTSYGSTGAVAGNNASVFDDDTIIVSGLSAGEATTGNLFGDIYAADLEISKSASPAVVAAGGELTFTLTYSNNGPSNSQDVVVTDTLDSKLSFGGLVSVTPPIFDFSQAGQTLTWEADTITAGVTGTIVYAVTVHPAATGSVTNSVAMSSSTPDIDISNNDDSTETTIGDPSRGTIFGYVFEDNNGNGLRDPGEPGISGVNVTLNGVDSKNTDVDGLYYFVTNKAGVHSVVKDQPSGYFSTSPNEVHLTLILGNSYQIDFGEASTIDSDFAAIYGTVFEDTNSDETWDGGESGINDVLITLDGSITTTTDLYGRYTFSLTVAGENTVIETDPVLYVSTTPNTVTLDTELNNGYQVDFGDVPADVASCPADSYEEDDDYNQAAALAIGGEQAHDFCDDAEDWLKISVESGRTYTITTSSWGQRADTYLALFNQDGSTLITSNDDYEGASGYSSQIVWKAPFTGEYYLRTTNRADLSGVETDYDITVILKPEYRVFVPVIVKNFQVNSQSALPVNDLLSPSTGVFQLIYSPMSPLGVIDHSCADAYEVDDTWLDANEIVSGQSQLHSFDSNPNLYAADKDFAHFELLPEQAITFTVTSSTGTSVLLELFDSSGAGLGLSGVDFLNVDNQPAGHYYLGASPTDMAFGCSAEVGYSLLAEKEARFQVYIPYVIK